MSDPFEQQIDEASSRFSRSCFRPRYRVAWLTGAPQSGKSIVARRLSERHQWSYLDYTLTPGYFDQRTSDLLLYQPDDLINDLRTWCCITSAPVLILDELDALLMVWSEAKRRIWAADVSRLTGLPCGLLLVTHGFEAAQLRPLLPDPDKNYCFELAGERQ